MRRISLYISEPQYDQFQALAASTGRPYSELIREALGQYLKLQDVPTSPGRQRARPTARRELAAPKRPRHERGRLR